MDTEDTDLLEAFEAKELALELEPKVCQALRPYPKNTLNYALQVASAHAARTIGSLFLLEYRGGQFYEPAQNEPTDYAHLYTQ